MRIVIDLDGTICNIKKNNQSYNELTPIHGAAEKIKELRKQGHYIIIFSSRHMATCESNIGKVVKRIGKTTLDWLEKYSIEYDEIFFGKPNAEIYIDDRSFRFSSWEKINEDVLQKFRKER